MLNMHSSDPPPVVGGPGHFGLLQIRWGLGLFLISGGASRHRWDLLLIGGGQHMIDKNLKVQEIPTMNCSNFCPD